ncbi:unnamed protein product [Symbiodinium sp. CCMP2592]|nr:unnamed protein product [Symbiodinium sp. CCMP2592]
MLRNPLHAHNVTRQAAMDVIAFSCTLSQEEECLLVSASQGMDLADGPMVLACNHTLATPDGELRVNHVVSPWSSRWTQQRTGLLRRGSRRAFNAGVSMQGFQALCLTHA